MQISSVGRYQVIRWIKKGGVGSIYLAKDVLLNRKVALKFVLPEHTRDHLLKDSLIREARAIATLNHENIVTVYDIQEHDDSYYIAMQFILGQSLQEILEISEISPEQALDWIIQLCRGLNAAHQKNVVHRDIKPGNIMIDQNGRVKIIDFGFAQLKGSDAFSDGDGLSGGTLPFMSPEQFSNATTDHRSDIFATGVVLYRLLTGTLPFMKETPSLTCLAIQTEVPPPLNALRPGLPEGLQHIIDKLLAKAPNQRYAHMQEVIQDLEREVWLLKAAAGFPLSSTASSATDIVNRIYWHKLAQRPLDAIAAVMCKHAAPVTSGWHLLDDEAALTDADSYKIIVQSREIAYLYVFQIDAAERLEWLFPKNERSRFSVGLNPISPFRWIGLPDQENSYFLDDRGGNECIYIVITRSRWKDLEYALSAFGAGESNATASSMRSRGVGGTKRDTSESHRKSSVTDIPRLLNLRKKSIISIQTRFNNSADLNADDH